MKLFIYSFKEKKGFLSFITVACTRSCEEINKTYGNLESRILHTITTMYVKFISTE